MMYYNRLVFPTPHAFGRKNFIIFTLAVVQPAGLVLPDLFRTATMKGKAATFMAGVRSWPEGHLKNEWQLWRKRLVLCWPITRTIVDSRIGAAPAELLPVTT